MLKDFRFSRMWLWTMPSSAICRLHHHCRKNRGARNVAVTSNWSPPRYLTPVSVGRYRCRRLVNLTLLISVQTSCELASVSTVEQACQLFAFSIPQSCWYRMRDSRDKGACVSHNAAVIYPVTLPMLIFIRIEHKGRSYTAFGSTKCPHDSFCSAPELLKVYIWNMCSCLTE